MGGRSRRLSCAVAAALLLGGSEARAACGPGGPAPRLGLVLSGGGARGIAHVGVLKALEGQGIRPDCIAGTSMGALVGALYAGGYSAARIEQIVRSVDWQRIYSGRPERALVPLARRMDEMRPLVRVGFDLWHLRLPPAAEPDFRLRRFLVSLLAAPSVRAGRDFDRLAIPFRAVAADLATGERVVLGEGSLEEAVRASIAAPVTLEPVRAQGRWLVDGGVVDNMPVGVARDMGAEVVVAVDTRSPPAQPRPDGDVVDVATQLADVLIRHRNDDFLRDPDVVVRPALDGVTNTDYSQFERAIAAGERVGLEQAAAIRQVARVPAPTEPAGGSGGTGDGEATLPAGADGSGLHQRPPPQPIAAVSVAGHVHVRESLVREAFGVEAGDALDLDAALRGLDGVWATRLFRTAWLDLVPRERGVEVVVHVKEAERGIAELGASFDETDKAGATVRVRHGNLFGRGETIELLAHASEARTVLRGELAVDGLFGFPLGYFAQVGWTEWRPRPFRGSEPLSRAEFDRAGVTAGAQTHLGPSLLLRAVFERARVGITAHPEAGMTSGHDSIATLGARVVWDTLDDRWRPTRGRRVSLALDHSVRSLGADHDYWRALGDARWCVGLGRAATAQLDALGFTSGGTLPRYEQVQLGGPVLAPGLQRDALWGPHAAAAAVSMRVPVLGGLQAVARAGAGGAWEERSQVSAGSARRGIGLGLQHDTPVGPVALEWGRSEGHSQVYFSIGYR